MKTDFKSFLQIFFIVLGLKNIRDLGLVVTTREH
jgi:hypothetical protein